MRTTMMRSGLHWITDEQLKALEENKLNETADEAYMWEDTMRDVANQKCDGIINEEKDGH